MWGLHSYSRDIAGYHTTRRWNQGSRVTAQPYYFAVVLFRHFRRPYYFANSAIHVFLNNYYFANSTIHVILLLLLFAIVLFCKIVLFELLYASIYYYFAVVLLYNFDFVTILQ